MASVPVRNTSGQFTKVEGGNGRLTTENTAEQAPNKNPPARNHYESLTTGGLLVWGNGGCPTNPCGFPGYDHLYTGSYETYRWMLQNPILQLVRSISVGPIGASTWEYEKVSEDVPDDYVDLIKRNFDPLRMDLLDDFFVRGRDFGWSGGEPIWETARAGETRLTRVKPLLQDVTEVLRDKFGNFVGLRNHVTVEGDTRPYIDLPTPYKAWKYTYDSEAGYVYGRSWLENVRATAWRDWLDCMQQLQKLGAKISGTVTIITSPAGTFPSSDGTPVSYKDNAEKVIKALANGASGAWFPSLQLAPDSRGKIDAMKLIVELAGKSLTSITPLDFGSHSPAIGGLIARMSHDEELMFAGGLRPSRTGLEGEHGTKAEAGIHTDTGTINSELDDTRFGTQVQPLVDAVLTVNRGPKAAGTVFINPPSLVNRRAAVLQALLLQGANEPSVAREMFRTIDMTKLFKVLNVPSIKTFDPTQVKEPTPKAAGNPQGGRPTENNNA